MNYIFSGNTLYSRGSRGSSTSSAHGGSSGPKLRQWSIRSSSEETAKQTPSRWRRVLTTLTRLNTFTDCIVSRTSQVSSAFSCRCAIGHRLSCGNDKFCLSNKHATHVHFSVYCQSTVFMVVTAELTVFVLHDFFFFFNSKEIVKILKYQNIIVMKTS